MRTCAAVFGAVLAVGGLVFGCSVTTPGMEPVDGGDVDAGGFVDYDSHVVKSGRQQFIEIGLVAPSGDTETNFERLDAIRAEIAAAMGAASPGYWLTVDFTADKRWI